LEWFGLLLAFVGFVYLMLPYLQTPSIISFILMTTAGVAWGIYSLLGQGSGDPLVDTAINFLRTLPLMLILAIVYFPFMVISPAGVLWAVLSGSLTSGVGYAIWYKVLPSLSPTQAATLQLLVPVIAALGGVLWIGEAISWRLIIAALFILGGILFVVFGKVRHNKQGQGLS
jgi:drug/metabolite transporter (DMT)-like permease